MTHYPECTDIFHSLVLIIFKASERPFRVACITSGLLQYKVKDSGNYMLDEVLEKHYLMILITIPNEFYIGVHTCINYRCKYRDLRYFRVRNAFNLKKTFNLDYLAQRNLSPLQTFQLPPKFWPTTKYFLCGDE